MNLRHLRVFLAALESGSLSRAAELCHVSQPAASQGIGKLERHFNTSLFQRTPLGITARPAGLLLGERVRRAFRLLDSGFAGLTPRSRNNATLSQLKALIAVCDCESTTLAARRLGVAQPTMHRAVQRLEQDAGKALFERTSHGLVATRAGQSLARAAQLAMAELDQAEADIAESQNREAGRIVIGAMPLSRSSLLPASIVRFRQSRSQIPVHAVTGTYADLLAGLRRGEIDFLLGALRDPAPVGDIRQIPLFNDDIVFVCRPGHPALDLQRFDAAALRQYPWVVSQAGTPTRELFDRYFSDAGQPASLVECGSLILMRQLLQVSDHLGCLSRIQADIESAQGSMAVVPLALPDTQRPIGITRRVDWEPTAAQKQFLAVVTEIAQGVDPD